MTIPSVQLSAISSIRSRKNNVQKFISIAAVIYFVVTFVHVFK